ADRIIDGYTELAPNFKSAIIDRQVIGPYDMEQELGLIGGNIFHGELSVDQLFHMRPAPGYADYRTPIKGLYHGSSATHAGGGVTMPVDLGIVRVANHRIEQALTDAVAAGAGSAVTFSSLYEEDADPSRPPLTERLATIARDAGMAFCGGNGMGFLNLDAH